MGALSFAHAFWQPVKMFELCGNNETMYAKLSLKKFPSFHVIIH